MSGVVALLGGERVVRVCCGDHRPTVDCLCCCECPTGVATAGLDPAIRALLAHDARERRDVLVLATRRAEYALGLHSFRDLYRATYRAVRVLTPCFPHMEGSLA